MPIPKEKIREIRLQRKLSQRKANLKQIRTKLKDASELYSGLPVNMPKGKGKTKYFTFEATKGFQGVQGTLSYDPRQKFVDVRGIGPQIKPGRLVEGYHDAHKKVANKSMSKKFIREALGEIRKRFPKATHVIGHRVTGAKSGGEQVMKLPEIEKLPEKVGGTMAMVRYAKSKGLKALGPLGIAAGAAGIAEQASAAPREQRAEIIKRETAGQAKFGLGMAALTKTAPTAAKVLGKVAVPLAVAGAAYDVGRTAHAGYGAFQAYKESKENEKKSLSKYGTVEAATKTRKKLSGR